MSEQKLTLAAVLEGLPPYIDEYAVTLYWENEPHYNAQRPLDELSNFVGEFEESYCGSYGSEEEFAEEYLQDVEIIPEGIASYIDYERVWRDFSLGGDFYSERDDRNGGYHIFRSL
jgi:antirestriction protein